jgi:hypothetical protein
MSERKRKPIAAQSQATQRPRGRPRKENVRDKSGDTNISGSDNTTYAERRLRKNRSDKTPIDENPIAGLRRFLAGTEWKPKCAA